ncbi:unnamed protein product [Prorocentrum cordatum]|uniref:Uncharacterized protein n=1 Tax=Prorocentrum cordatum TaxID=2364126 RepID=A0ABN9R526_9DINO|nr:unnamed protein product [Polarella glacialis]
MGFFIIVAFFLCAWMGDRRKLLDDGDGPRRHGELLGMVCSGRGKLADMVGRQAGIRRRCCCCRSAAVAPAPLPSEGARDHAARAETEAQPADAAPPSAGAAAPEQAPPPAERPGPRG